MTTYTWPTDSRMIPARADLQVIVNARHNASAETGVSQGVTRPGSKWGWSVVMTPLSLARHAQMEALLARLSAYEHRLSVYDWKRPTPRGTCNTSGVSVSSTVAQFATTAILKGCGANTTLLAGDWFKFSSGQLVMVAADATANGSGVMTVEFRHSARASVAVDAAITLTQPTALYVLTTPTLSLARSPGPMQPPIGFDLMEVFQ
jgi:hypothetical protein